MPSAEPVRPVLALGLGAWYRSRGAASLVVRFLASWALTWAAAWAPSAAAAPPELTQFEISYTDEGVVLNYGLDFELSHAVQEALSKSVPLYFVAEVDVFRSRWYWRDRRVAHTSRTWRVVYAPLTATYRVSSEGLSQSYASLSAALAGIRRTSDWKIAERADIDEGSRHYAEFSFRLDTTLLPRPLQIGLSGQPDWTLQIDYSARLP